MCKEGLRFRVHCQITEWVSSPPAQGFRHDFAAIGEHGKFPTTALDSMLVRDEVPLPPLLPCFPRPSKGPFGIDWSPGVQTIYVLPANYAKGGHAEHVETNSGVQPNKGRASQRVFRKGLHD